MGYRANTNSSPETAKEPSSNGLTPSDQLVGIFLVNAVISAWVGIAFASWYDAYPHLPKWMYAAEAVILVASFALATFDAWWPKVANVSTGEKVGGSVSLDIRVLKVAVVVLAAAYIFVLWRLSEETGGVVSPFAPFLTAPALFAPFVTKNWKTIVVLSIVVTIAIAISHKTSTLELNSLWPYKGTAAVMVLLAGLLTALRMGVVKRGAPLTGEGSDLDGEVTPSGDQGPEGPASVEGAGA
jgi:hypothetical protein